MRITAVGDISFTGANSDTPDIGVISSISEHFNNSDLVVGNLENPLTNRMEGIKGKCVLRGSIQWASTIKEAGIDVLSLANNHMMDYGVEGLTSTIESLDKAGIIWLGAGRNQNEAESPRYVEVSGAKVAFLARSSVEVSSHCYATENMPGVAYLNMERTLEYINKCRLIADVVVLMIHWGIEQYQYPSPDQRSRAKKFIDAGVDLLIGHHPHVVQGIEYIDKSIVAYSLGNFLFNDIVWINSSVDGTRKEIAVKLSSRNREGILFNYNKERNTVNHHIKFTRIDQSGEVKIDISATRESEFRNLCRALKFPLIYKEVWKLYAMKKEWELRFRTKIFSSMNIRKIAKIRPSHFADLVSLFKKSSRIVSGKSTNPYE